MAYQWLAIVGALLGTAAQAVPSPEILARKQHAEIIAACETQVLRYGKVSVAEREKLARQQEFQLIIPGKLFFDSPRVFRQEIHELATEGELLLECLRTCDGSTEELDKRFSRRSLIGNRFRGAVG